MKQNEAVTNILKLMDACKRCERILDAAEKFAGRQQLRQKAGEIRLAVARYEYELYSEIQRIDPEHQVAALRNLVQAVESDELIDTCKRNLEVALQKYRVVLNSQLPAHARAMIARQFSELERFCQELIEAEEAA
jgi:hypothetical protein